MNNFLSDQQKKKIKTVILIALSALLFFAFGELFCRTVALFKNSSVYMRASSNKDLGVEYKPNIEYMNKFGIKRKLNSTGFEGPELSEMDKNAFRIIFLGDSVIEGGYLPAEKRLPALLGKKIYSQSGKEAVIWNAGVGGYNSWQVYELIKDNIRSYHPDLVVVGICQNDFVDTRPKVYTLLGRAYLIMRDGSRARFFDRLYQNSELYKFVYDTLNTHYRISFTKDGYRNYLKNYKFEITKSQWEKWISCLKETHDLFRRNDVRAVFLIFPLYSQLVQDDYAIQESLSRIFTQENIPFIDLSGAYRQHIAQDAPLYIDRDIIHPNEKGFAVAADELFDFLNKKGVMPERVGSEKD